MSLVWRSIKMADKFPCVTCEDLPTCEALKWVVLGKKLAEEGFPVTKICITCPKDGVTYTAAKEVVSDGR